MSFPAENGGVYDVAIIGLGPAGAALARLLKPELRVAVIDRKDLSGRGGSFSKPCGGLLAPDAQKVLSRFGLSLPKELLADPQIFSVKTLDLKTGLIRFYQRFYINLDRHKFDLWMASLVGAGRKIFDRSRCTDIRREDGGFAVLFERDGEPGRLFARRLVGADGASSLVRRRFFRTKIRQYTAIQQWFPEVPGSPADPFYAAVFDPALTDCYAWGARKDGGFVFGAALPKDRPGDRFEELKKKLVPFGYSFGLPEKTEACLVSRPASPFQFALASRGVFLLGEAAGFISPSSLEGISCALESALILSRVLNAAGEKTGPPGRTEQAYRRSALGIRFRLCLKLLKVPFMYRPFLRRLVMLSGIASVKPLPACQHSKTLAK